MCSFIPVLPFSGMITMFSLKSDRKFRGEKIHFSRRKDFFLKIIYSEPFLALYYFMCVSVWPPCMYDHHKHAWCPQRPKKKKKSALDPIELE